MVEKAKRLIQDFYGKSKSALVNCLLFWTIQNPLISIRWWKSVGQPNSTLKVSMLRSDCPEKGPSALLPGVGKELLLTGVALVFIYEVHSVSM